MQTISGRLESLPRWELCVADINQNMPMAVGRLYVQKFFEKEAKHEVWLTPTSNILLHKYKKGTFSCI